MTIMVIMINSKVYLNDYKRQKNNNYDGDDEKSKKNIFSDNNGDGDQPPVKEILGRVAWYEFITKLQNL